MVSQPKAPDPYATSAAQMSANIGSSAAGMAMNNMNETSPYGSLTYTQTGTTKIIGPDGKPITVPQYARNVSLSPEQQQLYNKQNSMMQNIGDIGVQQSNSLKGLLSQPLTADGVQSWQTGSAPTNLRTSYIDTGSSPETAFSANNKAVQDAMMGRWNEQNSGKNASEEAQMIARGMAPGSQGYGQMQDAQNRARTDANFAAQLAGGQEQSRLLGESRNAADFSNQATQQNWQNSQGYADFLNSLRGSQMGENTALRNQQINEISALMGGSQVTTPDFAGAYRQGVSAPDVQGNIYNSYGINAQNAANTNKGIFGLAGSLLTAPMTGGASLGGTAASKLFSFL